MNTQPYVELHCHSYFSLLDGASSPEDLVAHAAQLGMSALALTDHDAVYGAVRFIRAAREHNIQPILASLYFCHKFFALLRVSGDSLYQSNSRLEVIAASQGRGDQRT